MIIHISLDVVNERRILGEVYIGEYRNNVRQGKGRMTYSDGSVFEGRWDNDKKILPSGSTPTSGNISNQKQVDDIEAEKLKD